MNINKTYSTKYPTIIYYYFSIVKIVKKGII